MEPAGIATIGKYRVIERLGRGGTADVYKAFHPHLERFVAVKVLHPHLLESPDFVTRFRREAQAIARLHHPNIVQVFDFDVDGERPYMVMEYIAGGSLKSRLDACFEQGEVLPLPEVLRLFRALLDAVGYAHADGMIHRDLKPANVIVDEGGRPVLTDFGIARLLGGGRLTASGTTVGTPAYMSPEQGQGRPADERSDIYALGVMLFECVAGHLPFDADTSLAMVLKHIHEPVPSLRALKPDVPPLLEQVVNRALEKKPADRFASAAEMWSALAGLPEAAMLAPPTPPPQPPAPPLIERAEHDERFGTPAPAPASEPALPVPAARQRPRWLVPALAIVAVAVIAGLVLAMQIGQRPRGPSPAEQAVAQGQASLQAGNAQLAIDAFTAALVQEPQNVDARLGRALAYEQLGQVEDAAADVESAIQAEPEWGVLYAERARLNVQYGLVDPPALALADIYHAVELIRPETPSREAARIYFVRGWALLNYPIVDGKRDPAAAIDDLAKAAGLDESNAEVQLTLAQARLGAGQPAEALSAANRAVELAPEDWLARKLRANIQFALGDLYATLDDLTGAIGRLSDAPTLATLYAERAYVNYRLKREPEAQDDLEEALRQDSAQILPAYVAQLLAPESSTPEAGALARDQGLAPDDPIWQAVFEALSE